MILSGVVLRSEPSSRAEVLPGTVLIDILQVLIITANSIELQGERRADLGYS